MSLNPTEIARRREVATLTQQEAADRAGWPGVAGKVKWSELERGRYPDPQLSTVEAVARVLGCKVDDLLSATAATPGKSAKPKQRSQKRKRPSGAAGSNA